MGQPSASADSLDEPTVHVGEETPAGAEAAGATKPGTTLGRYVVIDELGRGGMGVVLRAYDPRLQREIALKRLHPRMITDEDRARVVREARALAKISHPNVVGVFDVEESEGSVTLVMEHVRGVPLSRWLERPREVEEILAVLLGVGAGLAAAHAEGVLHRDVKPANVIVGDDGRARILDFGLARPGAPMSSDGDTSPARYDGDDALTRAGTVMGTPSFMAPEQHLSSDLTPAADQFAFCVMAWEALTGARPYVATSYEALAKAKLSGPPPWPKSTPRRVPPAIVDAVRRGLAPDPAARWPTVRDLLGALAYDPAKRRRQLAWIGATAIAAGATWAITRGDAVADERCTGARAQLVGVWDDATRERARSAVLATGLGFAEAAWTDASTRLDAYAVDWATMHQDNCAATAIRREQSEQAMDLRMACLERARGSLGALGAAVAAADIQVVGRLGPMLDGLPPLSRCADLAALEADVEPPSAAEADQVAELRSRIADAKVQRLAGKYRDAAAQMEEVLGAAEALTYQPLLAETLVELGQALEGAGSWARAETILRRGFELALGLGQRDEATTAAINLVLVLGDRLDRYAEAHAFESAARGLIGPDTQNPERAAALAGALSHVLNSEGRYVESVKTAERGVELLAAELPPTARQLLEARTDLMVSLRFQRRFDEAIALGHEILDIKTATLGPDHPDVADTLVALARTHMGADTEPKGEPDARRAREIRMRALGPDHPSTAEALEILGTTLLKLGRVAEAEPELVGAHDTYLRALGPAHASIAGAKLALSDVYRRTKRRDLALQYLAESAKMFAATLGPDHLTAAMPEHKLAELLAAEDRLEEAAAHEREALRIMEKLRHPVVPDLETSLADILLRKGELSAALAHAERGYAGRKDGKDWTWAAYVLAKVLWETGDRDRALQLARLCRDQIGTDLISAHIAERVTAWLAEREKPGRR